MAGRNQSRREKVRKQNVVVDVQVNEVEEDHNVKTSSRLPETVPIANPTWCWPQRSPGCTAFCYANRRRDPFLPRYGVVGRVSAARIFVHARKFVIRGSLLVRGSSFVRASSFV